MPPDGGTPDGGTPDGGAARDVDGGTPLTRSGIDVDVTLDAARAVSKELPLAGGSITATGADGTTYELIVPSNALEQATTITLTPVVEVSDLPLGETGRTTVGVQFAPEGLFFFQPATLVIKDGGVSALPLERQLFVQWQESGKDLTLAYADPTSREIRLVVHHFSGMAVLEHKGFDAALEPFRMRYGGQAEIEFHTQLSALLTTRRQRAQLGISDPNEQTLNDLITGELGERYAAEVLEPRFAAAETACAAGRLAMLTAEEHARQLEELGEEELGLMWQMRSRALFPKMADICMREEYEICRDAHLVHRIRGLRQMVERLAELLESPDDPVDDAQLDGYVRGCLKFELGVKTTASAVSTPRTIDAIETMEATVPLVLEGALADWISGPLRFANASAPWCPRTTRSRSPTSARRSSRRTRRTPRSTSRS